MIKKSFILISIVLFFSSCAFHSGYLTDSTALNQANFNYVKKGAEGKANATYVLGIGGLNKATLVDHAKQQLNLYNALRSNQAMTNVTVNFKTANYLLFIRVTCVVTADIVEFTH